MAECSPSMGETPNWIQAPRKPGVFLRVCNPGTQEVEKDDQKLRAIHPQLQIKFKAISSYMRL